VQFFIVYIREAHPSDGWQVGKNTREGIEFKQPTTEAERLGIAKKACSALKLDLPTLIDGMDNKIGEAYAGWPDRLFVVDHEGKISFRGERGPRGFDPEAWETGIKEAIKKAPKPEPTKDDAGATEKEDPAKDKNESGDSKKQ
jgi:hypothetical protein